jgi:UDP-N-acetylmuramoyl-tripeptide--D-alanyl-D-alanine ligase
MSALWTSAEAAKATGGVAASAWEAHGVSIDSRIVKPGDLFVALEGPNRDGHGFTSMALGKGASAALVARGTDGCDPAKLLMVKDTQAGLEALGAAARARTSARVCAVTGSVGKTSTKEALRHVLSVQGATHASEASYNNLWGVPLTLARMPAATRFGVFEIGMNHADEIRPLVAQVKPHAAIVTAVEAVHLENFRNIEGIADAKAEIFEGLEQDGLAIINADTAFAARLAAAARQHGARVRTYGEHGEDAQLLSVSLAPGHSDVEARILGRTLRFRYGAPGRHLVQNGLGVLLMVDALGGDVEAAAASFATIEAVKGRGQRVTIAIPGGTFDLIDESYNANPASMAAALALLGQAETGPGGRRIAVMGDMLELGPDSAAMHAALAKPVEAAKADLVFASGPMMAHLWDALPAGIRGAYGPSSHDIASQAAKAMSPGDVVMVKGSLGSRMALVVDALKARAAGSGPA